MFRILLIEDDYQLLRLCTRLLQDLDYEVYPAATSHAALDMFRRYKGFSLCISDVTVGGYNPIMHVRDLYDIRQRTHTPMLIMSADIERYRGLCEELRLPSLAKPFSLREFTARARELVVPLAEASEMLS